MAWTTAAPLSQHSSAEPKNVSTVQELFIVSCMNLFLKNILTWTTEGSHFPSSSAQVWHKGRVSVVGAKAADVTPTLLHGAYCFSPWSGRRWPCWPAPTSPQPLAGPHPGRFGRQYLCWTLHFLSQLQHWGGWWEEGTWWVDKLKRQTQTNQGENIIPGTRSWPCIAQSPFIYTADTNEYVSVHRFNPVLFCLSAGTLSFHAKARSHLERPTIKEHLRRQWQWLARKARGEKHFLSTYYVSGTFTHCYFAFS